MTTRSLILALTTVSAALAQTAPHAGYIYPAGSRAGTTVEVRVGGQSLAGASRAFVSGEGVEAKVVRYWKPVSGAEAQKLRDEARELRGKDPDRMREIRDKLDEWQRAPSIPAIAELVTLEITVAPDAKPGPRRLRIDTNNGLTNPVLFLVGDLPEYTRKPTRVAQPYNVVNGGVPATRATPAAPVPPTDIAIPAVCNAQMMPGVTDRYRFTATKGQRLRIAAAARELIPYLSDAVPGWFQAAITLRDSTGRELARADHTDHQPDPALHVEIPADGEYTAEIHDSIFRGREDFIYRLTLAPEPPATKSAAKQPKRPEKLKLPATVQSAISKPGEVHRFRIDGKTGEQIAAEVLARRTGSPLDSTLRLTDKKGRELAANDDVEDKGAGLLTHHSDSHLLFRLPAKGTYYLELSDAQNATGPYRLRVSRPQPDFELRVVPATLNIRPGATLPITVHAIRRDGFAGEISLGLKNAPSKYFLSGAAIPAGQDKIRLTLTASPVAYPDPFRLDLTGTARIDGREVTHTAQAADDMEQAFAYHHLVAQDQWLIRTVGSGTGASPWRAVDKPVTLQPGPGVTFTVPTPPRMQRGLKVAANDAPEGITVETAGGRPDGIQVTIRIDAAKAKPGLKGNLILEVWRENAQGNTNRNRRQRVAILPAIPFAVQPPTAGPVSNTPAALPRT